MKPFCARRPAFGVKSSFGARHHAASGLTLNTQRTTPNMRFS